MATTSPKPIGTSPISSRNCLDQSSTICKVDVKIPFAEERVLGRKRWTEYCIQLTKNGQVFTIYRRYSEFYELQWNLQQTLGLRLAFPSKKIYGNLSPEFVEERRKELETYLKKVLEHQHARDSPDVHAFFDCQQGKYLPCSSMGFPIMERLEG